LIHQFFDKERAGGLPLVAAMVISTQGSTYRKAGALMLFSSAGQRCGLLSGGCLESDLQEHALLLLRGDARCMVKTYDSRGSDDPVWGLGLGCEGLMQILLLRVDQSTSWEPLASLFAAERERRTASVSIDIHTGAVSTATSAITGLRDNCFTLVAEKPPALLICGAGPDAEPVAALAALLDWQVTVVDHRPAYIDAGRFPKAVRLIQVEASKLAASVTLDDFDAAVVMSHHLIADGRYLGALARSSVPYVGLLGPAARRERLIAELGEAAKDLRVRLRAPVGLDLGGRSPEAIALSIVAEIQAVVHSRPGMPFSAVVDR
jgi:xanthine/CO dehydrogenase XdhC/CoxF family maturation factor